MAEAANRDLIYNIILRYIEVLRKEINVRKVILYGSYSKGTEQKDSDIDLAVVSEDFMGDPVEDQLKLMKLRRQVDMRIEARPFLPTDFNGSDPMVQEILDSGTEIGLSS